jgi:DNA-binding SARP family transcriptional activator
MTGRAAMRRGPAAAARGCAALLMLVILVAGLPAVLYKLGGNPLPAHVPAWHHVTALLLHRDNGTVFLGAVRDISWLAWAAFTVAVTAEAQAAVRGRAAPRLRLGGLQHTASWLIALVALAFTSQPAAVLASTAPAAVIAVTAASRPAGTVTADSLAPQVMSMGFSQMVTVRSGDCLWSIAERYLGNGDLYPEIVKLNLGHDMGGGQRFTDPSVIWPGWVLQLPASPAASVSSAAAATSASPAAIRHAGHPSGDPRFSHPHPAAAGSRGRHAAGAPAAGTGPAVQPPAPAPARTAAPAGAVTPARQEAGPAGAPGLSQAPPLAVFGAGMLVGGASVALARMRRRQRQARRFGRRIPVPASAPVIAAEQRLRAAERWYSTGPQPRYDDGAGSLFDPDPEPDGQLYDGQAAAPERPSADGPVAGAGPVLPATALRGVLSELGAGLLAAGQPIPDVTGLWVHRSGLELLLASPSSEPPPPPFAVPGGRQGTAWRLDLPEHALPSPARPGGVGDLLPGLLTAGAAADGGYLLIDLEYLRVTTLDGPADLVDLILSTAAAELTTSQLAGWFDLVLAGFGELEPVDGRATSCATLAEALDLLAAKAVALRRRLGGADRADIRRCRLAEPGDEDWALTLLVSRFAPTSDQIAMLADLAADPGGIAALVAGGAEVPEGHPAPASFRLRRDPAQPDGIAGHISPLHLNVWPQPLTRADYDALTSLFQTAAELRDVAPDEPPYDGSSWPPAPELIGLREPPPEDVPAAEPSGTPADRQASDDPSRESALRIGVLGTFTVNGAPAALQPAQSQLILALALNGRDGLSNAQLCYLLGADPDHPKPSDSLRQLIVRTRRQLGRAADGQVWIEHLGAGQYALHPDARFDWSDFEELSERGIASRDRGGLRQALALVRGTPFTGCYHWWLDVAFTETVRAQIVDTAELLAELELRAGDPSASARAARTGLAADVAAEQLWRALMRAEHAAGNRAGVREAWSRCLDTMTEISADGEPHPDTASLYRQLTGGDRAQPAWAQSAR